MSKLTSVNRCSNRPAPASASLAVVSLAVMSLASVASAASPYNIMPVGDSITAGYENNPSWAGTPYSFGYRGPLYGKLVADQNAGTGFAFNYVGVSQEPLNGASGTPTTTTNPAIPNLTLLHQDNHEGYGGTSTSFVLSHIQDELAYNNPNVVLLMVGINDIGQGSSTVPVTAENNLNSILNSVFTHAPGANLIVAQITPYYTPTPAIVSYNSYIRTTVAADAALGYHVSTVDQYANFLNADGSINTSLYANGINHPNDAGYALMATTWYNGIKALDLPVSGPATPNPVPPVNLVANGNFELHAGAGNSHIVNPSGQGWTFTQGVNNGTGSGIDVGPGGPYGTNFSSYNGEQMGFLQGSGNSTITSMSQSISGLVVGQQYVLNFDAKGIAGFTGADPFHVEMDGSSVITPLFGGAYKSPPMSNANDPSGYTAYSATFIATDTTETLKFADAGDPVVTQVSWIDAVSVSAVPEPASATMLAAGAALSLSLARRRRSSSSN